MDLRTFEGLLIYTSDIIDRCSHNHVTPMEHAVITSTNFLQHCHWRHKGAVISIKRAFKCSPEWYYIECQKAKKNHPMWRYYIYKALYIYFGLGLYMNVHEMRVHAAFNIKNIKTKQNRKLVANNAKLFCDRMHFSDSFRACRKRLSRFGALILRAWLMSSHGLKAISVSRYPL